MDNDLPLYKLFSPKTNPSAASFLGNALLYRSELALGISRAFLEAELVKNKEAEEVSNKDQVTGFRSVFNLVVSCLYNLRQQEPMMKMLSMNNLANIIDEAVYDVGKNFLNNGSSLLKSDPSGRQLVSYWTKHLQTMFPDREFHLGAEVAQAVYDEALSILT